MRITLFFLGFCLSMLSATAQISAQMTSEELLNQLDKELDKHGMYERMYLKKVDSIRCAPYTDPFERDWKMYDVFRFHNSDSAGYYADQALQHALLQDNKERILQSQMAKSLNFCTVGLMGEAYKMKVQMDTTNMSREMKLSYYQYQVFYYRKVVTFMAGKAGALSQEREQQEIAMIDSVLAYTKDPEILALQHFIRNIRTKTVNSPFAVEHMVDWVNMHEPNTRSYAIYAQYLSQHYDYIGDEENKVKYLALSAIADVRCSYRDVVSLQNLALESFKRDNIDRATLYLNVCLANLRVFKNRIRGIELSDFQGTIFNAYTQKIQRQAKIEKYILIALTLLVVILALGIWYVLRQHKKLEQAQSIANEANIELQRINSRLQRINSEMKNVNEELKDANRVKEMYIGQFLQMCSEYANKIGYIKKYVTRKIKAGKAKELIEEDADNKIWEAELQNLFSVFDEAFLNLYPNFIEQVNELFLPEERFAAPSNHQLNTELRICALIRLGIKDSSQIASFTGYSVNTIYTYRTKMRNKSICHADLEGQIMKIN